MFLFRSFPLEKLILGLNIYIFEASTKWTQQRDHLGYLQSNEKGLFSFLVQGENSFTVDFIISVQSNWFLTDVKFTLALGSVSVSSSPTEEGEYIQKPSDISL